jgi:glutathione S-transferase
MRVKLYRCRHVWLKLPTHPCWRVQRELDAAGIDYEIVRGPVMRRNRDEVEQLSGQRLYPVIAADDGRVYRADSKEMAARIRSGHLLGALAESHPGHDVHDRAHEGHAYDTESL